MMQFTETESLARLGRDQARRARLSRLQAVARTAFLLGTKDCALELALKALEPSDLVEDNS